MSFVACLSACGRRITTFGPSIATCACKRRAAAKLLCHHDVGGLLTRDDLQRVGVGVEVVALGVSTGGDTSSSSLSLTE